MEDRNNVTIGFKDAVETMQVIDFRKTKVIKMCECMFDKCEIEYGGNLYIRVKSNERIKFLQTIKVLPTLDSVDFDGKKILKDNHFVQMGAVFEEGADNIRIHINIFYPKICKRSGMSI